MIEYALILILVITFVEYIASVFFMSAIQLLKGMYSFYKSRLDQADICVGSTINQHRDAARCLRDAKYEIADLRQQLKELQQ